GSQRAGSQHRTDARNEGYAEADQRTDNRAKAGAFARLHVGVAIVIRRITLHFAAGVIGDETDIVAVETGIDKVLYCKLCCLEVVIERDDGPGHSGFSSDTLKRMSQRNYI